MSAAVKTLPAGTPASAIAPSTSSPVRSPVQAEIMASSSAMFSPPAWGVADLSPSPPSGGRAARAPRPGGLRQRRHGLAAGVVGGVPLVLSPLGVSDSLRKPPEDVVGVASYE